MTAEHVPRVAAPRRPLFILGVCLMSACWACGKMKDDVANYRQRGLHSKSGDVQVGANLSFSGVIADGKPTSQRVHTMSSRFRMSPAAMEANGLQAGDTVGVKITLRDPDGEIVAEQTQDGILPEFSTPWTVKLNSKEGDYALEGQIVTKGESAIKGVILWKAQVELDTTQPTLAFEAKLSATSDGGSRQIAVAAHVAGETDVTCSDASLQHPNLKAPLVIKLKPQTFDRAARAAQFASEPTELQDLSPNGLLVTVRCRDAAGNQSELVQPISAVESRQFSLKARVDAPLSKPVGTAAANKTMAFVNTGLIAIKIDLIDSEKAQSLGAPAIAAEKSSLRLYVTEQAITQASDLTGSKTVLWNQAFAESIRLNLPAYFRAAQMLYVSLVRHDANSGQDSLIGMVPLDLFIDTAGPELSWQQAPDFKAPTLKQALAVKFKRQIEGAPLATPITAEYTSDGLTWKALPIQESSLADGLSQLQSDYPLAEEAPFRVRLRAVDLAGNTTLSAISPNLIGRAGIQLDVTNGERISCLNGGQPASRLYAWVGTSFACRRADIKGELSGSPYATILWQNRGQVAPSFYASSQIAEGLGYKVLLDGEEVGVGRFSPPDLFRLGPSDQRRQYFSLNEAWLTARRLEIVFDAEASDAYSTTNACYPDALRYPRVVLQDLDKGLSFKTGPFACDPE